MKMQGEDQDVVVYADPIPDPIPDPDTIPEGYFDDLVYLEDDPEYEGKFGSTAVHRKNVKRDKQMIEEAMDKEYNFMGPRLREIWDVGFSHTKGKPYFINRKTGVRQFERPTNDLYERPANPPPVKLELKQASKDSRQKEEMLKWHRKFHEESPPGLVDWPIPEVLPGDLPEFELYPGIMEGNERYNSNTSSE
jgi:hypothetical protein